MNMQALLSPGMLLENTDVAFVVVSSTGEFVDANAGVAQIFGVPRDELLTMGLPQFIPDDRRQEYAKYFDQLIKDGRFLGDIR